MDDRKLQTTEMGRLPRQPSGTRWTGRIATVQRSSARRGAASINVGGWFCRRHPDKVGGWFVVLGFQKSGLRHRSSLILHPSSRHHRSQARGFIFHVKASSAIAMKVQPKVV